MRRADRRRKVMPQRVRLEPGTHRLGSDPSRRRLLGARKGMSGEPADLFGWAEQRQNLARVNGKLSGRILAFCRLRREFHMEDLRDYLREHACDFAPDSPSRILRQLRLEGAVDYTITNRRQSAYRVTAVRYRGEEVA